MFCARGRNNMRKWRIDIIPDIRHLMKFTYFAVTSYNTYSKKRKKRTRMFEESLFNQESRNIFPGLDGLNLISIRLTSHNKTFSTPIRRDVGVAHPSGPPPPPPPCLTSRRHIPSIFLRLLAVSSCLAPLAIAQ